MRRVAVLLALLLCFSCFGAGQRVHPGAEVLIERFLDSLKGRQVGIVCNQTSILPNGTHIVDTLLHLGIHVTALFGPEHGIRGAAAAGASVNSSVDAKTGLPIYSLYGKTLKPTAEMLHNVDVILFDLQDVGARFYTYASTMADVMESARDFGKKFILLDRPNPINGRDLEGPVLDMELISFLGLFPIPLRHGLTLGELAKMIVGEGWLNYNSAVDLTVIPMEGWKRSMWFDETLLPWVPPSPNMKSPATATVYPGTCLFEATNVTEGRGTPRPFEFIGAPGMKGDAIAAQLNRMKLPGVLFEPVEFTPAVDSIAAPDPKYKNKKCGGIFVRVTDRNKFRPVQAGLMMLAAIRQSSPRKFQLRQGQFDHLFGDSAAGEKLIRGRVSLNVLDPYRKELDRFRQMRGKYLLYQ